MAHGSVARFCYYLFESTQNSFHLEKRNAVKSAVKILLFSTSANSS